MPVTEWDSFYVIIGSSAAALTGLMFVVIALATQAGRINDPAAFDAFATPTIVHFGAVLLIAAFLTTPRHTIGSLRACIVLAAIAGVIYATLVIVRALRQTSYVPELEDWIWHGCLPVFAYACLLIAGILLRRSPEAALYGVAAAALLLLFIGIHNAWDSAVWMTTRQSGTNSTPPQASSEREPAKPPEAHRE